MALTRAALKKLGIEEDAVEAIIQMHAETVDALKGKVTALQGELDPLKESSGEIGKLREKLDTLQSALEESKSSYDTLKSDFDSYKSETSARETRQAKEKAYRELLRSVGIKGEKRLDAISRLADLDALELAEDGTLKNADQLKADAKSDWGEFITTSEQHGADTKTPPDGGGSAMTKADIAAIKDPSARRAAIAANLELFDAKAAQSSAEKGD